MDIENGKPCNSCWQYYKGCRKLFLSQPALGYRLRHRKALAILCCGCESLGLPHGTRRNFMTTERMMQDQRGPEYAMNLLLERFMDLENASSINCRRRTSLIEIISNNIRCIFKLTLLVSSSSKNV